MTARDAVGPAVGPLLALDTSGEVGSVAIGLPDGRTFEQSLAGARDHSRRLIPALGAVLGGAGLEASALAGVVVGAGPGSFTGVRVGVAAALGLARAAGCPLWWASSLAAAACSGGLDPDRPWHRLVLVDARGDRLFAAGYRWSDGDLIVTLPPRFLHLAEVVPADLSLPSEIEAVGSGAERHRVALREAGIGVGADGAGVASASALLMLAREVPGGVTPWQSGQDPLYLRGSSAERGV